MKNKPISEKKNLSVVALILFFLCLPVCETQETGTGAFSFPVISRIDSTDVGFKQYISDVENSRRQIASARNRLIYQWAQQTAENLTIYQYTTRQGDSLLSVAARCNIPYSALVSLNRLGNMQSLEEGTVLLLPSCPGIFVPKSPETELEKLIGAARLNTQESVELTISAAGRSEQFYFFPGEDFTPTERAFFLNSGFRFPLRNYRMTSAYGIRENPLTGNISMHQGVDLAAPIGTEVYAVADGVVTEIGEDPVYGIYIVITHQNRWTSLYGHLQKVETVLLSEVKSTSLIGRVGTTGQSTGPHLHFELRQDGRAINPSDRLRS